MLVITLHPSPNEPAMQFFDDTPEGLEHARRSMKNTVEEAFATWGRRRLTAFKVSCADGEKEFISIRRIRAGGFLIRPSYLAHAEVLVTAADEHTRAWLSTPDQRSH